ncbi:hypothetical protein SAMN06297468_0743 [Altererythrobacter xiamenensis]|uniref:Uncharacterized protein n=1 Tax=Altererythrobacter xiamenensis TaxID=1316679 RepID=A0A1Y6EK17_9SPHN|nr:hypothetical protein [Altererythrobacter xiamenensis]SMQ62716.1 hypothetical protein SAMN06297468_0743 [Altererythrobacter xiamenensis]
MIGKIIGASLGAKAAQNTKNIGGPMGAAIGAAAPFILRRLSIPAMLAIAAGGYAYKKYSDKKDASGDTKVAKAKTEKQPPVTSTAPATSTAGANSTAPATA